jgi:hypothetical protein
MTNPTLEERVGALEKLVVQLMARVAAAEEKKDWRSTIGMFANDPIMKEIQEAGQKIREADRRRARKEVAGANRHRRKSGRAPVAS